jgi:hypothetical protein
MNVISTRTLTTSDNLTEGMISEGKQVGIKRIFFRLSNIVQAEQRAQLPWFSVSLHTFNL